VCRRLLLQLFEQQRPLKSHPRNAALRTIDFPGELIVLGFDVDDFAFQVFAFCAVTGFFCSRVRRMVAPCLLQRVNKGWRGGGSGGRTAKECWVGEAAAMIVVDGSGKRWLEGK
jgi:hypothetical protein